MSKIKDEIDRHMPPDYFGSRIQWLADVVEAFRDAVEAADIEMCKSDQDIRNWRNLLVELPPDPPRPPPMVTYRVIWPGTGGSLDAEVIRWSVEATPGKQHVQIEPSGTLTAPGMPGGSVGKPWRLQRQSADGLSSQEFWLDVARSP